MKKIIFQNGLIFSQRKITFQQSGTLAKSQHKFYSDKMLAEEKTTSWPTYYMAHMAPILVIYSGASWLG